MGIRFKHSGDFKHAEAFFRKMKSPGFIRDACNKYGRAGVAALAAATPKDSGQTAASWSYEITESNGRTAISFSNSNRNDGVNIAIILQYGHGTNNGGYVQGRDYINPALRPIFDQIAAELWREVTA